MLTMSTPVEQKVKGRPPGSVFAAPFPMRFTVAQMEAVDEWRRNQPDLPSRTEAIRRLVEEALKAKRL
ncbi:hypothetical protein [Methylobacterium fujisawaense]|uniref:hypothetical protein n=1 Tax=Methylobacterium fujisawaense TaxID=107400 RepID=UPI00313D7C59